MKIEVVQSCTLKLSLALLNNNTSLYISQLSWYMLHVVCVTVLDNPSQCGGDRFLFPGEDGTIGVSGTRRLSTLDVQGMLLCLMICGLNFCFTVNLTNKFL